MTTSYDEVAYPSLPFHQTHPVRLATPAVLFGLDHVPVDRARILEIGCGEGGNIIPLAVSYPQAELYGFDLAASAIAVGAAIVDELGLRNIQLEARDILDVGPEIGQFDYIIAHGVYSWVPDTVREGLLRLVSERLSPDGVAFISYNALPGCSVRQAVREMLTHHLGDASEPSERIDKARAFLQLMVANGSDQDPTAAAIRAQCQALLNRDPRVMFHDELGEFFHPFYMHQVMADAGRHGLAFLSEVEGSWWREELFPSSRGRAIRAVVGDDAVAVHQYQDFLAGRVFRQTLFTHADRDNDRKVDFARLRKLWITGAAQPQEERPDLDSAAPVRFSLGDGVIELDHPGLKRALTVMGAAFPRPVAVADLPDDPDVHEGLLQLYTAGKVELSAGPPASVMTPGPRPRVSPLIQLQLARGQTQVSGVDHTIVLIDDALSREFLSLLDGTRNGEDIVAELVAKGSDRQAAIELVDRELVSLAKLGLFVA